MLLTNTSYKYDVHMNIKSCTLQLEIKGIINVNKADAITRTELKYLIFKNIIYSNAKHQTLHIIIE